MRILLTNDDGYRSEGISVLESFLVRAGHEVWVCAPSQERSASSHSMTLHNDITITEYDHLHFHCSGTPADCILYAGKGKLFEEKPDLVISGINHGYNISTDILYSGTVGAAREAALTGLKSMAVSCMRDDQGVFPFAKAAAFVVDHLDLLFPFCSSDCILNINVPPSGNGVWKPAAMSYLDYSDAIEKKEENNCKTYDASTVHFGTSVVLSLKSGVSPIQRCDTMGSDFQAVSEGFISITALAVLPPVRMDVQQKLTDLYQEGRYV